jgi:hypothetical protein
VNDDGEDLKILDSLEVISTTSNSGERRNEDGNKIKGKEINGKGLQV